MVKSGHKRPTNDCEDKGPVENGGAAVHWANCVNDKIVKSNPNWAAAIKFGGGSDSGEFIYIAKVNGKVSYVGKNKLHAGDVVFEIQNIKVSGFTSNDVIVLLNECFKSTSVIFKCVPGNFIPISLRQFLNLRFPKGSIDHALQNTIRDNLYLRTVPVTTRKRRDKETDGVDYKFLTIEQFFELEHNGELIENGVYEGNCYGTPKPSNNWYSEVESKYIKDSSVENLNLTLSGLHPSSEGKRKRNRSNVEAMASKNISSDFNVENSLNENSAELYSTSPPNYFTHSESKIYNLEDTNDNLGPLPAKWEKAYTDKGEVYFIDHNSSTSHWLDPRLSRIQKKSLEDCSEDELPYGWERIDDPLYGTYYIDHVNRQTQYENPVIQAKCNRNNTLLGSSVNDDDNVTANDEKPPYIFTSDPKNLVGERIRSTIIKSYKGLGFTIVGGGDSKDEFLQIKSIVKNGPAWCEGKLQTGDVLVYMNNKCVLGYTHQDMVNLFQSIAPGETVELEVCRGYPLPFDPNDPNTEVVTTVAVGGNRDSEDNVFTEKDVYLEKEFLGADTNNLTTNSVKSVHDMYSSEKVLNITRPTSSTDFAINNNEDVKPEFLTMSIVKGAMGFGFTIADSAYGQKVKKILDKPRCKMLMEGDVLVEINHICVRNICHSEVVQVLKDCPKNLEATITVERINYGLSNNNGNNSSAGVDSVNITNGGGVDKSVVGIIRGNNNDNNNNGTDAGHQFGKELDQSRMKKTLDNALNFRSKTPTTGSNAIDYNNGYEQKLPPPPFVSTPPDGILTRSKTPVNNFAGFSAYHQQQLQSMALRNENELDGARNCYSRGECVVGNDLNLTEQKNDHAPACTSANMMWYHQRNKVPHEPRYVVGSSLESASASVKNYYNTANNSNNGDPPYGSNVDAIKSREDFTYANSVVSGSLNKSCYSQNSNSGLDRSSFDDFYNGDLSENYYCSPPVPPSSASSVISHKNNNQSSAVFEDVPPLPNSAEIMRMYSKPNDSMDVVNYEPEYVDSIVTIFRQAAGFGFRIVGGTEEGSQVSIGHIVEGGAAEQDGRLQSGDEIISVDNQCVMNSSHHHVVQLMGKAAINGKVTLRIRRKITSGKKCDGTLPTNVNAAVTSGRTLTTITSPGSTGGPVGNLDLRYPYDVVVRRGENEGFGFVIISSLNKVGSTIGRILEGSPAARCGQLRLGDQIIAVNHVNILNFHHGDIVNLIKDSGYAVTLTIGPPPLDDSSSTASIPLSHKEDESEEGQYYEVQVSRGSRGFGFSIRGGKEFQNMNLYVLQIAENGPAAASGRLKVGDRLIEINGISTKHMTHAQAIEVIRNCGPTVHLLVQRGGKVPPLPAEEQMICSSLSPGSAASINYGNNNDNR